jgi:hypothetical protein
MSVEAKSYFARGQVVQYINLLLIKSAGGGGFEQLEARDLICWRPGI